jgi:predicted ATPase
MKLVRLQIENFRGITFEHDFSNDQFIVLTGANGSGKSTIIEALDILLTKQATQIQENFAKQATSSTALFDVTVNVNDDEVKYLAEKIHAAQPNQPDKDLIEQALKSQLFINGSYSRKIEIDRPILGWSAQGNSIREYINGTLIDKRSVGFDELISQSAFNALSQELVLKFEQLESISLQFSNFGSRNYSIRNIFQPQGINDQTRISRTNVTASSLLDSLIQYSNKDYSKVNELLAEYNVMLEPFKLEIGEEAGGLTNIVLRRNAQATPYTIDSASSGQKKAIVLATLKYVWKDSVFKPIVLLDEPENSMHPGLTTRIFESLNGLAHGNAAEPSFIIATHSPEVVAANPNNTYRIITDRGSSRLEKIVGLEARAKVLGELGVHFHLDYVAQKIVFVESVRNRTSGELSDEDAYQKLIDPQKEEVLFISVGNNVQTEKKYEFQNQLFESLKSSSPHLVQRLKDRDNNEYDETCHTPFRHIEYLYVASSDVLANALNEIVEEEVSKSNIDTFLAEDDIAALIEAEDFKTVWGKIIAKYRLRGKAKGAVQSKILNNLYEDPSKRSDKIQQLIDRYRTAAQNPEEEEV